MLDPNIRKFLSNIGKRGGAKTAEIHEGQHKTWGKKGAEKRWENWRKANPWFIPKKDRKSLTK